MEYDKKYSEKIYPELPVSEPTAPPEVINQSGHDYRIAKINEIQSTLEKERDKRRDLSKKYGRGVKWVNNVDTILVVTSMGLGVAGVYRSPFNRRPSSHCSGYGRSGYRSRPSKYRRKVRE